MKKATSAKGEIHTGKTQSAGDTPSRRENRVYWAIFAVAGALALGGRIFNHYSAWLGIIVAVGGACAATYLLSHRP